MSAVAQIEVDAALDDLIARYPALDSIRSQVLAAFELLSTCFSSGGKVLTCGNGGSAADAAHVVGELMKGMMRHRPLDPGLRTRIDEVEPPARRDYLSRHLEGALPAIDLGSQEALLTAIGNDTAGDIGFAQQVVGYGRPGDVLWGFSTSGRSTNVVLAAATARAAGVSVLAFTGAAHSELADLADIAVQVPATTVQTVQEFHLPVYHTLCQMIELRHF